jgi:tetratricopeptide (TPR) repeat protein
MFHSWALHAFRARHYREAMKLLKHAIIEDERTGTFYLLLSQTQLAVGEYETAAKSLRRGLALLDRADWGYLVDNRRRLYTNDDYDRHLETLSKFIHQNPHAAFARFLHGYHAVFWGHMEAAREDLGKAAQSAQYLDLSVALIEILEDSADERPGFEELPTPSDAATE